MQPLSAIFSMKCGKAFRRKGRLWHTKFPSNRWIPTVGNWHPDNKAEKRNGFVDVPMLEATRPDDRLTLDFRGKAIGIFCVSGPSAGILEYSVDGAPFKELDTFTQWSHNLYIPWVYMLETELEDTDHKLVLRISKKKNPASLGRNARYETSS